MIAKLFLRIFQGDTGNNSPVPFFIFLFFIVLSSAVEANGMIKCPINRDVSISSVGMEKIGNNGISSQMKLKSIQEYILCDVDIKGLKGLLIKDAVLHFRSASPLKAPVSTMGISTFAADWVEGRSQAHKPEKGASCFVQAQYGVKNWAYEGSTLMDVVFGRGHTIWDSARCSPPDGSGWQQAGFDSDVFAARIAVLSKGFCLYDDVGSEWFEAAGKFQYHVLPNRMIYSRESFRSAPWIEIKIRGRDMLPPEPVDAIEVETDGLPAGEAFIFWKTPLDRGGGKTLGFDVSWKWAGFPENKECVIEKNTHEAGGDNNANNTKSQKSSESMFPRYLIPMAGKPGETVKMHIQDIDFTPKRKNKKGSREIIEISVVSVDEAGNRSRPFVKNIRLSGGWADFDVPQCDIKPFFPENAVSAKSFSKNDLDVRIIDMIDKYVPGTGDIIPKHGDYYKRENHIFSASRKLLRLHGAKNEDVCFQVIVESQSENAITFETLFEDEPNIQPVFYRFENVKIKDGHGKDILIPDPLLPVETWPERPGEIRSLGFKKRETWAYVGEIYIPHDIISGLKKGELIVKQGNLSTKFNIDLMVWDFTLPDKLSFVPEMNAYSRVSPCRGYEYYRLAHRHRTCLNRLPYGWDGLPEFAPVKTENGFFWDEWDRYVGPLLDGSIFYDLPRKHQPVDVMYLPLSENWPVPLKGNYKKSWWADEALSDSYRQELKQSFQKFASHLLEMPGVRKTKHDCHELSPYDSQTQTQFQFYLNNKVYYRERFNKSSAPWIFDEPIHIQDFMALKWYGDLWHEAVEPYCSNSSGIDKKNNSTINTKPLLCFRCDISYTQFGRDILWDVTDIEYLGGNNTQKTRMKHDEFNQSMKRSCFAEYGTANKLSDSNLQPVLWQLSAWLKGACGVLPWQTIGSDGCWERGEQTALFYPKGDKVYPSVRLKAFRYGQQLVEYLVLLADRLDVPQAAVGHWLKQKIGLNGTIDKKNDMDAGTVRFDQVTLKDLWQIRCEIGKYLSDLD